MTHRSVTRTSRSVLRRCPPCSAPFASAASRSSRSPISLLRRRGKRDDEPRTVAVRAIDEDRAFRRLDDPAAYGETETGAVADLFRREERLEDFFVHARGNAGSAVLDLDA